MMKMYEMKVIGPGTKFDTAPLPMDKFPSQEFMEMYGRAIANREGFGKLLGEGTARLVEALGRTDDFNTLARQTMWGFMDHWSMPGVEWAYGNLLDSRDINSHDISWGRGDAEQAVKNYAAGTLRNEPLWFDYTWQGDQAYKTGIYSKHKAEWVAWHQHYWNYYKESVGFCDWGYCQLNNGRTPTAEPTFLNAITGRNHSFNDGLEIGRRAWTLKRAIFVMQGRHKKMENFTGYHYRPGASYCGYSTNICPYSTAINGNSKTAGNSTSPKKESISLRPISIMLKAGIPIPAIPHGRLSWNWECRRSQITSSPKTNWDPHKYSTDAIARGVSGNAFPETPCFLKRLKCPDLAIMNFVCSQPHCHVFTSWHFLLLCVWRKSGEWWKERPVTRWSTEQVYEFLNTSPWVSGSQGYFQQAPWVSGTRWQRAEGSR